MTNKVVTTAPILAAEYVRMCSLRSFSHTRSTEGSVVGIRGVEYPHNVCRVGSAAMGTAPESQLVAADLAGELQRR
jgi:hypothetical protein